VTKESGVMPVAADLLDESATKDALAGLPISHALMPAGRGGGSITH